MKTQISFLKKMILVSMFCFLASISMANSYEQALGQALQSMSAATETEGLLAAADQFERIANAEKKQWLPFYYAAFSCASTVMRPNKLEKNEKEQILARSENLLNKAIEINPTESELFVLQGLLYQLMISNPADGATFAAKSTIALEKAGRLNNENPRVYYIQGTLAFYTPESFGGGPETAKPLLEKAKQLFDTEKQSNPLLPNWGKEHNEQLLKQCK